MLLHQVISFLQAASKCFVLRPAYIFRISGSLENRSWLVFEETTKAEPEEQGSSTPECSQLHSWLWSNHSSVSWAGVASVAFCQGHSAVEDLHRKGVTLLRHYCL